jgi:diaminopimelate decarboxylase
VTKKATQSIGRSPGFVYAGLGRERQLHCDNASLTDLAGKYGTPLYVYSETAIRERFATFTRAFGSASHTVCYSVKANSNLAILQLLAKLGSGFDVVSGGELERVLRASRKAANKVVFSGVGKTAEEIELGIRSNILLFNIESEEELDSIGQIASRLRKQVRIAFRVNPDVSAETHPYIATGLHDHKFGVPLQAALELYRGASKIKHLEPCGVSVHIGSQITKVDAFAEAMTRVADLVKELRAGGFDIAYVDAGGGLGISYHSPTDDYNDRAVEYARSVTDPLRKLKLHLLLEPGRAIVGPAGALLTRVLYRKKNDGKTFVITDAAMNDLIRPSLYGAHHEILRVEGESKSRERVDVVGPICETGDYFARDRELPVTESGDLLAIMDAGAYGMSLASNYNTRPRAAEILVKGSKGRLIRKRESIADLMRNELPT